MFHFAFHLMFHGFIFSFVLAETSTKWNMLSFVLWEKLIGSAGSPLSLAPPPGCHQHTQLAADTVKKVSKSNINFFGVVWTKRSSWWTHPSIKWTMLICVLLFCTFPKKKGVRIGNKCESISCSIFSEVKEKANKCQSVLKMIMRKPKLKSQKMKPKNWWLTWFGDFRTNSINNVFLGNSLHFCGRCHSCYW